MEMGGMNFKAKFVPFEACIPADFSAATLGVDVRKKIPHQFAVVRDTDLRILGIVSDDYRIVQNSEAFAFTDELLGGGDVRYETGGVLISPYNGACKTWILAKSNKDFDIFGDKIAPYVCFVNSFDGKSSMIAAMVTTRVVCQNTLTMALGGAKRVCFIEHTGDIQSKVKEAQQVLGLVDDYVAGFPEAAEKLLAINLYADEVTKFLDDLFPAPEVGDTARRMANRQYLKDIVLNRFEKSADLARFKGTAWALYNSVVDVVNHVDPFRKTQNWQANRFLRVVDGHDVVQRSQALLMEIRV
jgi:phage/plasmid-like protein (TIGR03299 family)